MKRWGRHWWCGMGLCLALQGLAGAQQEKEEIFEPASVNVLTDKGVEQTWIEMYGVRLNSATRELMRQALRAQGVKPVREDDRYWVDVYDAKGLIRGATQFYLGYTVATKKLAFAEYAFNSFMDTSHTQYIVGMVTAKYGSPYETVGKLDMGAFTARWRINDGMQIQVVREWPDTSTYLKFIHPAVELEMKAELAKEMSTREAPKLADGGLGHPKVPVKGSR